MAQYYRGEKVRLDGVGYSDGKKWGMYIGRSGERRYVCLENNGERYGYFN